MQKCSENNSIFDILTGPILLLAGPGTGKTHQLAKEIKYLIDKDPSNKDKITVITFTDEAKRNMKNRLSDEEKKTSLSPPTINHLKFAQCIVLDIE